MTGPTQTQIAQAAADTRDLLIRTPVLPLTATRWDGILPDAASITVKLELFQQAGSFKARGVLLGIRALTPAQRAAGVVAASGGNHALAVSWAAQAAGVSARIAMPRTVDPLRIDGCRALGADVSLHDDMAAAFDEMDRVVADDGRAILHPFEGAHMTLGAAVCGAEYLEQVPQLDTLVVPVGGGGLISGMAAAAKAHNPDIQVIGVEPVGADSMTRSLAAGHPVRLDRIDTIADSLSAPRAMPASFAVAQAHIDRMVHVTDDQMRAGMRDYLSVLRLLAEPACAASLAAICGPLRHDLAGRHVGIIACGSNISLPRYQQLLA
ncbi:threonine/serine dehydratase [Loktanella sp. SALINAS62]|uniref:threonine ammonia-lyase n=1 Tax=Loktanella sp. SALINAS62 TaxID=2706124 RepID=UPI001B8D4FC8|nr:threonine/serine dehydratase [Loktanella sp. SALINAS62]MBS1303545.1 threonine/serine dehydratase [Loktanella sp. SALINAS62]